MRYLLYIRNAYTDETLCYPVHHRAASAILFFQAASTVDIAPRPRWTVLTIALTAVLAVQFTQWYQADAARGSASQSLGDPILLTHTQTKAMTQVDELEVKLFRLLKEDNWSDENAQEAVRAVKGLQRDAIKELPTKVDLANLKVDIIKWMVGLAFTAIGVLSAIIFGIVRFFA